LAVDPALRGTGLGVRLADAALDLAAERGVARVFLLTETAGGFFPKFGFRTVQRGDVDSAVQRSQEFSSLCPESAQVMMLDLAESPR
jgi:amino-acid N-acetyltransferase